jgi:phosphoribosyl 1,2-cyclic phosphate phosphodiesterase
MRVTILGCGGSGGVPLIGDDWGACNPENPRNRRLRVSILVEKGDTTLLVDTSPDLRQQLLSIGVSRLDGVLYTHTHADHVNGIDDLRPVNRRMNAPLGVYGSAETMADLRARFGYVFEPIRPGHGYYKPHLIPHEVSGPFAVGEIEVVPFEQDHGFSTTTGYRFGPAAYSTDAVDLSEAAFAALEGVTLWIVDCLRLRPHETHAHLDKALGWIARVKPERAVLIHMNQTLDYDDLAARLPEGVVPAHDGLALEVGD